MNRVVINGVDCSPDVLARERKVYEDMARGYLEAKAEADGLRLAVGAAAKDRDEAVRAEQEIRGAWLGWRERARLAEARLNRIREWAGGLGWLGSPQDERVETEALAILDSVDRWQSCPDYIRGLPHTECAKCGGFGAVPAPQKGAPE